MRIRTILRYLIGNRQAILELAANRRALWVGLLFVLSAGFAREYDSQDLSREPWLVLVPLGASVAASFLLFIVACGSVFLRREGRPSFVGGHRSFLTLFWMTAPLAWLYAIPYERFLSAGDATRANLWTLGLVAAWRVVLMIRVVCVITGRRALMSTFLVMAFADAVALIAVELMPKPVVSFMGGVRLTESEQVIYDVTCGVSCLGMLTMPIWGIGALVALSVGRPTWRVPAPAPDAAPPVRQVWILAIVSLVVWLPLIIWTQGQFSLRSQVEADLLAGRLSEAFDVMSAHRESDFPPHWDPPPRIGYDDKTPHILDVMDEMLVRDRPAWVRRVFINKFRQYLGEDYYFFSAPGRSAELPRIVSILKRLPEGPAIAAGYRTSLESKSTNSDKERENVLALLELAGKGKQ